MTEYLNDFMFYRSYTHVLSNGVNAICINRHFIAIFEEYFSEKFKIPKAS